MAFTREAVSQRHRPTSFGWSFPVSGAVLALTAFGAPLTDYTLAADTAAATVTGTDASLEYGRLLSADSGTFTVAGTDANLASGRRASADAGAYALTGAVVDFRLGRGLTGAPGTCTVTGAAATLTYGQPGALSLVASGGTLTLTGGDAALRDSGGTSTAFYISYRSGWRHTTAGRSGQRYGVVTRSKPLTS